MIIISLEGNIGSGKSTLLNILKEKFKHKDVIFLDEPVSEWLSIHYNNSNILELFYEDKEKYSFTFQILAYITRLRMLLNTIKNNDNNDNKVIICERSIYTDKFVFAKMLFNQGYISEIEWKTYNYWFDTFKKETNLDYIIYVNTLPELCLKRIKKRSRSGESNITLDYLKDCHKNHLDWINSTSSEVITFNGNIEFKNNNNLIDNFFNNITSMIFIRR